MSASFERERVASRGAWIQPGVLALRMVGIPPGGPRTPQSLDRTPAFRMRSLSRARTSSCRRRPPLAPRLIRGISLGACPCPGQTVSPFRPPAVLALRMAGSILPCCESHIPWRAPCRPIYPPRCLGGEGEVHGEPGRAGRRNGGGWDTRGKSPPTGVDGGDCMLHAGSPCLEAQGHLAPEQSRKGGLRPCREALNGRRSWMPSSRHLSSIVSCWRTSTCAYWIRESSRDKPFRSTHTVGRASTTSSRGRTLCGEMQQVGSWSTHGSLLGVIRRLLFGRIRCRRTRSRTWVSRRSTL
jgi:hypothetical protein